MLDDLKLSLDKLTEKMNEVAVFFCQETKKFKLEELFLDLLNFLRELETAQKVRQWAVSRRCDCGGCVPGEPPATDPGGEETEARGSQERS